MWPLAVRENVEHHRVSDYERDAKGFGTDAVVDRDGYTRGTAVWLQTRFRRELCQPAHVG